MKFEGMGITPDMVENTIIPDKETMIRIKYSFRTRFETMMSQILKVTLEKDEEKLSCIIISYYEINLDEDLLVKALSQDRYLCLMFIWAFNKNYIGS